MGILSALSRWPVQSIVAVKLYYRLAGNSMEKCPALSVNRFGRLHPIHIIHINRNRYLFLTKLLPRVKHFRQYPKKDAIYPYSLLIIINVGISSAPVFWSFVITHDKRGSEKESSEVLHLSPSWKNCWIRYPENPLKTTLISVGQVFGSLYTKETKSESTGMEYTPLLAQRESARQIPEQHLLYSHNGRPFPWCLCLGQRLRISSVAQIRRMRPRQILRRH